MAARQVVDTWLDRGLSVCKHAEQFYICIKFNSSIHDILLIKHTLQSPTTRPVVVYIPPWLSLPGFDQNPVDFKFFRGWAYRETWLRLMVLRISTLAIIWLSRFQAQSLGLKVERLTRLISKISLVKPCKYFPFFADADWLCTVLHRPRPASEPRSPLMVSQY